MMLVPVRIIVSRRNIARLTMQSNQIANKAQTDVETRSERALRSFATAVGFADFGPYVEGVRSHYLLSCWTLLKQFWFTQFCDIELSERRSNFGKSSENLKIYKNVTACRFDALRGRKY